MNHPTEYPGHLARHVAGQIDQLADMLASAPHGQAAQVLREVLDADDGVLGRLASFLATSSYYAKDHVTSETAEVWQDLARGANRLHDLALDLAEPAETFARLNNTLTPTPGTPPPPPAPAPAPGARRR